MNVLVVDDHEYNRELLTYILDDEGYTHLQAANGKEACELCAARNDIDLVLMDVSMPVMDGIQAARQIKQDARDKLIPIIFVTALDDTQVLARCLDAGGDDFVPKPINESVLLAKIKAHSRTRDLYQKLQQAHLQLEYHQKVMEREHNIIERIFERGLTRVKTTCDNIKKYTSPMSMFNGDIILEAPSPSGGIYNIIGDFTGHGLAASIGSLPVTEIFYRLTAEQASVGLLARAINKSLVELLPDSMFFCAAITYLDSSGKSLALWLGGMNDVLHVRGEGEGASVRRIVSAHMPLGILNEEEFDETPELIDLQIADRVYIYSDGVTEMVNPAGEQYGVERVVAMIQNESATSAFEKILSSVRDFHGNDEQDDDISLVEILAAPVLHRERGSEAVVDIKTQAYAADSFPWQFSMQLRDEELKNNNVIDQIMRFVGGIRGIELHSEKLFTIISELYSNALEHGVLGLDSRMKNSADGFEQYYRLRSQRLDAIQQQFIRVQVEFAKSEPNQIVFQFSDSGQGFDFASALAHIPTEVDFLTHGRGLNLLKSLCSVLEYSDGGRSVKAIYSLCYS